MVYRSVTIHTNMSESPIKLPNITQNVHTNEYGVSGLPQTST